MTIIFSSLYVMTDIFGKGTELDDSEGIQTAGKAKELLDKLAEKKAVGMNTLEILTLLLVIFAALTYLDNRNNRK